MVKTYEGETPEKVKELFENTAKLKQGQKYVYGEFTNTNRNSYGQKLSKKSLENKIPQLIEKKP